MLILKLTSPAGETRYVTGAFPSACGKTNLAMLIPTLPDWKVETVGDDICWMKFGADGRLYAINPEAGFFGVAPGTNTHTNPNAMLTMRRQRHLHQHRAHRRRRRLVGVDDRRAARPPHLVEGRGLDPESGTPAAHPNARFTVPAAQDPAIASEWEDPAGVPIDAILFGGRRASVVPLVFQSRDWQHGVFLGSIMASETTAAAAGAVGNLRRDPFAMLPFCGYNMADYFAHWLRHRRAAPTPTSSRRSSTSTGSARTRTAAGCGPATARTPGSSSGCSSGSSGKGEAVETPIGFMPAPGRHRHRRARRVRRRHGDPAHGWTPTSGAPRCPPSASTSPPSATSCRPRWPPRSTSWSAARLIRRVNRDGEPRGRPDPAGPSSRRPCGVRPAAAPGSGAVADELHLETAEAHVPVRCAPSPRRPGCVGEPPHGEPVVPGSERARPTATRPRPVGVAARRTPRRRRRLERGPAGPVTRASKNGMWCTDERPPWPPGAAGPWRGSCRRPPAGRPEGEHCGRRGARRPRAGHPRAGASRPGETGSARRVDVAGAGAAGALKRAPGDEHPEVGGRRVVGVHVAGLPSRWKTGHRARSHAPRRWNGRERSAAAPR